MRRPFARHRFLDPLHATIPLAIISSACAPEFEEACSSSPQPGFELTVTSALGDICDAQVTAYGVDDAFAETLKTEDCKYVGVTERPGAYRVVISARGYQPEVLFPSVGEDACGWVDTKRLFILLTPDVPPA
ncbi:MAG: hypothetical protein IV100_22225 [Myxococcales bacterium]|nr:hypothetical protein [Myxococcales bacterium]